MMGIRAVLLTGLLTVPMLMLGAGVASAQSFDCARAQAGAEKAVCADPELADLDTALARTYRRLERRLDAAAFDGVRADQREWIARRDACGENYGCVLRVYADRLVTLTRQHDVFQVWKGSYATATDMSFEVEPQGNRRFRVNFDGASQNWQCSGTADARLARSGSALVIETASGDARLQAAGNSIYLAPRAAQRLEGIVSCGIAAPTVAGFYVRME